MKTCRLLFTGISNPVENAGQQKLYFLARELEKLGCLVDVAVPEHSENHRLLEAIGFQGNAYFFDDQTCRSHLQQRAKILKTGRWQFVHSIGDGLRALIYGRAKFKVLYEFDEWISAYTSQSIFKRFYLEIVCREKCRRAFGVICGSDYIASKVSSFRPDLKSKILYLPVGISSLENSVDLALYKSLCDRFKDRRMFFYIGNVLSIYREQIAELFDLAEICLESKCHSFILIAGAGSDLEYWKAQAVERRLDSVIVFEGNVPRSKLATYCKAATVLLFPYPPSIPNIARCPTKLFHYAAANRPLVTNRTGEVAKIFGDNAFYYEPGNSRDMFRACQAAILAHPAYGNGINLNSLTWESRAASYYQWLSGILLKSA
ncbi:MAG: glycosyltransferase [Verrucomicrobiae bacterium]|nr:glycosyltransferase [Verrucomicrobiae bacterium]